MNCHTQHDALVLEEFEAATWTRPRHLRNQFALIHVRSGRGECSLKDQHLPYHAGNLVLLGPANTYSFTIQEPTRFGVLTFTEEYLNKFAAGIHTEAWQQLRSSTLYAAKDLLNTIELGMVEQQQLQALLAILFAEAGNCSRPFNEILVESLMGAVLSLVGRHLAQRPVPERRAPSYAEGFIQRLLAYIRRHISEPNCLRVERLAEEFAYSPSHLSALFKQQTGESLRQYIVRYKLKLAETQLQLSTLTVSQIADELAFTDVCHLNKLFKKHYHATPSDYRRHLAALAPATA